jgi:hypothetical protein
MGTPHELEFCYLEVSKPREGPMKTKRFTDEQIGYALRQAEAGKTVTEVCLELGISQHGP